VIDKPLLDVAAESPDHLDIVRVRLRNVLKAEPVWTRNDILRRGALVHTDIALLLPERAAEYLQTDARDRFIFNFNQFEKPRLVNRGDAGRLVTSVDGEYVASEVENAHWSMARGLLHDIYPHPSADEFVQRWYRAVAALFEESYLLGNAKYHLTRALEELPHDPMILLYAGAMHEAYASEGVQSIPKTRPGLLRLPSSREEWSLAEPLLREAVKAGAPVEARLRHARVLGRLGKHAEAAAMLRLLEPRLTDPRLKYFAALFLGSEEGALGDVGQARDAFERAAVLCPTAQAPLVAMADLLRRSGNRTAVLAVLGRIQGLPSDPADRVDPWVDYFRSFALDSADQVDAVRAWVNRKEPR
jgi:tetratricopeptide (TPR) repeat protein